MYRKSMQTSPEPKKKNLVVGAKLKLTLRHYLEKLVCDYYFLGDYYCFLEDFIGELDDMHTFVSEKENWGEFIG